MNETVTYEMLVNKAKEYLKEDELAVLKKAYDYAYDYHQGKMRLSGEEEISHSLHVAYILAEIKADLETLAAALLHDVLEDNQVKESDLRKVFSSEIVSLVIGITKINRLNFAGDTEAMIDNHRKILVGLSEDVRVIIIKLADRLHNMRTLWALPEKVQKEKAKETLDILTPIAHRLGMSHIKSELEDLSLRYLKPDVYFGIVEQLNQSKK